MSITMKDLKAIKSDLAKRKPPKPLLDANRDLTIKEIITSLAPELTRMKSKGFSTQALVDILKEHKISIKGATLNRYLAEHKTAATNNEGAVQAGRQILRQPSTTADLV
ncbi:hypothetical protein LJB99_02905 [Deltaproteobacteria bacterium OttesenSCG-928-K17]|nr:hypothetical protein [Deltaproteobacteria bacterium OttesenSCG-928-K17]